MIRTLFGFGFLTYASRKLMRGSKKNNLLLPKGKSMFNRDTLGSFKMKGKEVSFDDL